MKKLNILFIASSLLFVGALSSCNNSNEYKGDETTIKVCASELPHADVLENCVKDILKEKGYTLKVTTLDWSIQNDAVASGDYDANYFQHIPYLNTFKGKGNRKLVASCKVHYEPLGIYRGKSSGQLQEAKSIEICNDSSNAIRALNLLKSKGIIAESPVNESGDELTFDGDNWTSSNGVHITLIAEELLVSSLQDYDFACLPCNTAYTGKVDSSKQVAKEDNPSLVSERANVLAIRKAHYLNSDIYKTKIDALTDALLSEATANYFRDTYLGSMTCDSSSQIDLRNLIK